MAKGNPRPVTGFKPGNQAAVGAKHEPRRPITQMLISALNEPFHEYNAKTKKFELRPSGVTKMRKLVDNLVYNATVLNDGSAIEQVISRVEGRPTQGISGPEGEPLEATTFLVQFTKKPPSGA